MENAKELLVEQAYFGEVNMAHGMLAASAMDSELESFLHQFTDRPGSIPLGVQLESYSAGTLVGSHFVFTRTFPDHHASRNGMVFTHALWVSATALAALNDLSSIFDLFLPSPPTLKERQNLRSALISLDTEHTSIVSALAPLHWQQLTQLLLSDDATAVFSGSDEAFMYYIAALWKGLPLTLREKLSYGMRFVPPDDAVAFSLPVLVRVQAELQAKWSSQYEVVEQASIEVKIIEPMQQWLLGLQKGNDFGEFLQDLSLVPSNFRELTNLSIAYALHSKSAEVSVSEARQLARLLGRLQPDVTMGQRLKKLAIRQLAALTEVGAIADIRALRNFEIEAFPKESSEILTRVFTTFMRRLFTEDAFVGPALEQAVLLENVLMSNTPMVSVWWYNGLCKAAETNLQGLTPETVVKFWHLVVVMPRVLNAAYPFLIRNARSEALLVQSLPTHEAAIIAEDVLPVCILCGWWQLHATIIASYLDLTDALTVQLDAEKDLAFKDSVGVKLLAERLPGDKLIAAALKTQDSKVVDLAGQRCATQPALFDGLEVAVPVWRKIWAIASQATQNIAAGIADLDNRINVFLNLFAIGEANGEEDKQLLSLVAASPFANVMALEHRAELWQVLPVTSLPFFIQATAEALVMATIDGVKPTEVEDILLTAIRDRGFTNRLLGSRRDDMASILKINASFANLNERAFCDYLNNFPASRLQPIDAVELGTMIIGKGWKQAANVILRKAQNHFEFRLALSGCAALLTIWERLINHSIIATTITPDEWWVALEQLALELYPKGPDEGRVWERADGDVTKLNNQDTRAQQWHNAIQLLRNSRAGRINTSSLLKEFKHDNHYSQKVSTLSGLKVTLRIP